MKENETKYNQMKQKKITKGNFLCLELLTLEKISSKLKMPMIKVHENLHTNFFGLRTF